MKAFVAVTSRCSFRCSYCHNELRKVKDIRVLDELLERLPKSLDELGVDYVILTGGDPFESSSILRTLNLIERLASSGIAIAVNTALAVPDEAIEQISRCAVETFFVSCDSHVPEIHNRQRSCHSATIKAIKRIVERGKKVYINCVVTKHNWHHLVEMQDHFLSEGVEAVDFNLVGLSKSHPLYAELACENLSFGDRIRLADTLIECSMAYPADATRAYYADYQIKMFLDPSYRLARQPDCLMGSEFVVIDSDGTVKTCFHASQNLGSIYETSEVLRTVGNIPVQKNCADKNCASLFAIQAFWEGHRG